MCRLSCKLQLDLHFFFYSWRESSFTQNLERDGPSQIVSCSTFSSIDVALTRRIVVDIQTSNGLTALTIIS